MMYPVECSIRLYGVVTTTKVWLPDRHTNRRPDSQTPDKVILMCHYDSLATQKRVNRQVIPTQDFGAQLKIDLHKHQRGFYYWSYGSSYSYLEKWFCTLYHICSVLGIANFTPVSGSVVKILASEVFF